MAAPEQTAGEPLFDVGSTAYVPYEGGKHYGARVIRKDLRTYTNADGTQRPMWYYLVHYMGWNKKYDEWVEEIGCRASNPDVDASSRRARPGIKAADKSRPKISIAIPPALKQKLVEDHDAIKKEGKLLPLPRTPCVEEVLVAYVKSRPKQPAADTDAEQVANGLRTYFDRSLALILLYAEERKQADDLIGNGTLPSSVYGAEHLLRLFVKLPDYLPLEGSTEEQYRLLQAKLHEVLDFLHAKAAEYVVPTAEYATPMQEG